MIQNTRAFKRTAALGQAFVKSAGLSGPRDVNKGPLTKYGADLHNGNLREEKKKKIKMKIPKRKLFLLIIFAYVAFSLYAAYNVFFSTKVISRVHRVVKKETGAPGNHDLSSAANRATIIFIKATARKSFPFTDDKRNVRELNVRGVLCSQVVSEMAVLLRFWRRTGTRGKTSRWSTTQL